LGALAEFGNVGLGIKVVQAGEVQAGQGDLGATLQIV
jgi:hypothetical protein